MESTVLTFVTIFRKHYFDLRQTIAVLCGQGGNGSDGLAIAGLLKEYKYQNVIVYLIDFSLSESSSYRKSLAELEGLGVQSLFITHPEQISHIEADLLIDAIIGTGLHGSLTGKYAILSNLINKLNIPVIAVDVPTGFPVEGPIDENYKGIKADLVISSPYPKLNFFFPESILALERFEAADMADGDFVDDQHHDWKLNTEHAVKTLLKPRRNFSHKGTYGHALIIAGNTNTMGAALLAASGSLYVGAGLTTLCLPQSGLIALNTTLPEVMALPRNDDLILTDFAKYTSIAIGSGLGIERVNEILLEKLLNLKKPILFDADALSILACRIDLLDKLPEQSMLTPHVKEFDRLFGNHQTWWERVITAKTQAIERKLIIILKNQYTFICLPDGKVHINQSGNAGMASGGMGDVLTGVIAGLLAQSYSPDEAAKLGVYLHGKAGDELAAKRFTITASQLAAQIPKTVKKLSIR
jgi:hydroxyethylthiazole kinase-like uncharacterized protein yjeF